MLGSNIGINTQRIIIEKSIPVVVVSKHPKHHNAIKKVTAEIVTQKDAVFIACICDFMLLGKRSISNCFIIFPPLIIGCSENILLFEIHQ